MPDITLSASTRTNLLSLQNTTSLIARTQDRLSTGRKVNSALDNAQAYFQAANLSNRASDLASLKDSVDQSISIVKGALTGISSITDLVNQMKGLTASAKSTNDTTERSKLSVQFDDLRTQVTYLALDSSYKGTNLIGITADSLTVTFDENSSHKMTITGTALDSTGLTLAAASGNWGSDGTIDTAVTRLDAALSTLRSTASTLGSSSSVLNIRLDFTKQLINTLQEGSSKLVNADMNEESANLLALQTRQQLGTISLSLAQQSEKSVLSLF
jgi:flagellin